MLCQHWPQCELDRNLCPVALRLQSLFTDPAKLGIHATPPPSEEPHHDTQLVTRKVGTVSLTCKIPPVFRDLFSGILFNVFYVLIFKTKCTCPLALQVLPATHDLSTSRATPLKGQHQVSTKFI